MPQTILRFSRWLLVGALFLAIGGHWAVLQTVAWATMLVDYSHNASLVEAVGKTFDGQHPCQMCADIQKNSQSEKKHEGVQLVKKVELFDQQIVKFVPPAAPSATLPLVDSFSDLRHFAPSVPPPRAA